MSFLKLESECAEGGAAGGNCLDKYYSDGKTTHDVNFYKDVIKRLQEELSKIKTENLQLRETILAYSIKLPQVSRKLNTLVTCLEAKAYKFTRKKTQKSKDEPQDSAPSGESSLNGEDDRECDLQDEASDEESSQVVEATPSEGVHHSVQNFVEIVCEEDNSVVNGSSTNEVNDAAANNNENPNSTNRQRDDTSLENNTKSSTTNTRISFRNIRIKKLKGSKEVRDMIINKTMKHKKSGAQDATHNEEQVEEFSDVTKEIKNIPEPIYEGLKDDVDIKIKMEESLEDPSGETDLQETSKRSKPQKQSQEAIISVSSTAMPSGTTENTGNNSTDLRRRRQRAYDCQVCGRTFARSSNLAHHVMRHRNERPHQCEICDRAFVQKANLKVHLRSHTGERPFSCNECGRAFAQKNNALRHLRAHARQRQLQEQKLVCPICGKSFGRWPSYENHMQRAHSNMESNTISHCIVEGMVNDSHPDEAQCRVGDIRHGANIAAVNIPHHVGNAVTSSQLPLEHSTMENVHSSAVSIVNVHANDNLNNGHLTPVHHPQGDHLIVGSHATIARQLSGAHSCSESAC